MITDCFNHCNKQTASILESLTNDYGKNNHYRYLIKLKNSSKEAYIIKLASEIDKLENIDLTYFNIENFLSLIKTSVDFYEIGCLKGLVPESNLLLERILKSQELVKLLKI